MNELTVNFSVSVIEKVSGWSTEVVESLESDLDFFLNQELCSMFPDVERCTGNAFYTNGEDYLVEAFGEDGNPVEGPTKDQLETVAKYAVEQVDVNGFIHEKLTNSQGSLDWLSEGYSEAAAEYPDITEGEYIFSQAAAHHGKGIATKARELGII